MAELEGGCHCGAVRYRAGGRPCDVTHCHCVDCRRTSGAAFVTWFSVATADLAWTRGTPARRTSSPGVERTFCAGCGTALTYQRRDRTGEIDVTAGSLDAPAGVTPEDHTWTRQQLDWIRLGDGLPRHATTRPPVVA